MRFKTVLAQCRAAVRRAPVLPDDGVVNRRIGLAIPEDRRFALVSDADGGDFAAVFLRFRQRFARGRKRRRPDLFRVMLDPAFMGVMLGELRLRDRDDAAGAVEHNCARRGRALIDGQDERRLEICHALSYPRCFGQCVGQVRGASDWTRVSPLYSELRPA